MLTEYNSSMERYRVLKHYVPHLMYHCAAPKNVSLMEQVVDIPPHHHQALFWDGESCALVQVFYLSNLVHEAKIRKCLFQDPNAVQAVTLARLEW